MNPAHPWSCALLAVTLFVSPSAAAATGSAEKFTPAPVIFDTDIGTDIDDAYALALLLRSPELNVLGVTTVAGDAVARARLAAKLLSLVGGKWHAVPVYAGISTAPQYLTQTEWAAGFTAPNLHESGGVDFMRRQINARPGEITLIAVGELTNVAALLQSEPGIAAKIKAIALMGGAVRRGSTPDAKPAPEWNIKSNAAAAQAVFTSGVPLIVAPLDSTADLKLAPEARVKLFLHASPLHDALAALDYIWTHTNPWKGPTPILFDALPIVIVGHPDRFELTPLHLVVEADGLIREVPGAKPNAQVALKSDPDKFIGYFLGRLTKN